MKRRYMITGAVGILSIFIAYLVVHDISSAHEESFGRETAETIGGFGGETTGGSAASSSHVYTVSSREELLTALGDEENDTPKIVYIKGTIDMEVDAKGKPITAADYAKGTGYDFQNYLKTYDPATWGKKEVKGAAEKSRKRAQKNQGKQMKIYVPDNTTIVGETGAKIKNASFIIQSKNVIIRNIAFQAPYDQFPKWDPTDGESGNWNAQYDVISLDGATNVWLDHNTFEDGEHLDSQNAEYYGREYQHHDGITDITNGSDNITISNNKYLNHDKTMLIGGSDKKASDGTKLHVTITQNLFENTVQRTPRVRFGKVHLTNNLYENDGSSAYKFQYAWGVGKSGQVIAQNNAINITNGQANSIVRKLGGSQLEDKGTLFNGTAVSVKDQANTTKVNWKVPYAYSLLQTPEVAKYVTMHAGVLK